MIGNIFSAVTGISVGDIAEKALKFVGADKSLAAGIGAAVDAARGNYVGALQNALQALTGTEKMSEAFAKLNGQGNNASGGGCGSAFGASQPNGILRGLMTGGLAAVTISMIGGSGFAAGAGALAAGGLASGLGGGLLSSGIGGGMNSLGGLAAGGLAATLGGGVLGGLSRLMGNGASLAAALTGNPDAPYYAMRAQAQPGGLVSKLPANATFEDIVSAVMFDTLREMRKEAMEKMREIQGANTGQGQGSSGGLLGGLGNIGKGLLGGILQGPASGFLGGIGGGLLGGLLGGDRKSVV